jgi:hypothetical protein
LAEVPVLPPPPVPPPPEGVVAGGALPPDGVVPDGAVAPLEGEVPPLDGVVAPPPPVVLVAVVDELLEVVVVAVLEATAGAWLGTVNGGAPAVSAVELSPPPQAARPTAKAPAVRAATRILVVDRRETG